MDNVTSLSTAVFRTTARLRRARAFHPRGVVMHATWQPPEASALLPGSPLMAATRSALVRLSHGVGLPPSMPDILGLSIKVTDVRGTGEDQDLLLASSRPGPRASHLLWPHRDFADVTFSTLLPYEMAGEGTSAIVARARPGSPPASYADILLHGPGRIPVFELRAGSTDGRLLATLLPGDRVPIREGDALAFDPWHTGSELRPTGLMNRLRQPTYAASRDGRGAGSP